MFAQSRVGINTTTPDFKLDIRSLGEDDAPDVQLATPETNHFMRLFGGRSGDPKPFILFHEDDTFRIATSLPDFANFTERITLIPSGNVGIGIGIPANRLQVHDPAIFEYEPPFLGYYGNETFIQVTNGVSGINAFDGLRLGVGFGGGGEIHHPYNVLIETGLARLNMFNDIVAVDSNLWVSKNLNLATLAGSEDLNLLIGVDGYLKTGPGGADTDWTETGSYVYNVTKNIGIGVVAPTAPLMVKGPLSNGVKGTTHIYNEIVTGVPPFEITSSHMMILDGNSIDITASGINTPVLTLQSISAGNIEMVKGGGRVGVGVTAPNNRKMTVSGSEIPPNQDILQAEATFAIINISANGFNEMIFDGNQIETIDETLMFNAVSPLDIIMAEGGGNVGVGISPNSRLTIEGPDNNGTIAGLEIRSAGNGQILLLDGNEIDATGSFTTLALNSNSGGAVTIGALTPATGYKLSVAGKMIAEEVRCQLQTSWPDYVFKDDYKLMSLDEMEVSIKTAGHLPGIPAASMIDGIGVDLGDMQVRMMEKIEELTLYILQLHERIAHLESKSDQLSNAAQ
jgi:hypothetical protein